MKGKFIVIEGCDGSGKTTLINNLKNHYSNFIFVREPGSTPLGEDVRTLTKKYPTSSPLAAAYLYCASRAQLVDEVIIPSQNNGINVVSDRFAFSSLVYQGLIGSLGLEQVTALNAPILHSCMPDLVIYLRTDKSFRAVEENDALDEIYEKKRLDILTGFDKVSKIYSDIFFTIDVTNKSIEEVFELAKQKIDLVTGE